MKKKLLFICTANWQRSPTAEALFKNSRNYEAKSAGTSPIAERPITSQAIKWADIIFCMEDLHKNYILENFPEAKNKKIIILNLPNIYLKNDPELVIILKEKLKKYLENTVKRS